MSTRIVQPPGLQREFPPPLIRARAALAATVTAFLRDGDPGDQCSPYHSGRHWPQAPLTSDFTPLHRLSISPGSRPASRVDCVVLARIEALLTDNRPIRSLVKSGEPGTERRILEVWSPCADTVPFHTFENMEAVIVR